MKKSIINRNYSLLALILLILYITYLNIPISSNMTGGGPDSNPLDSLNEDKLKKHLMKISTVYSILNTYFYVYVTIVVILLGITLYFGYQQYVIQGVPIAGVKPGIDWDNEGTEFLTSFFIMSRQKNGLNPPGAYKIDDKYLVDFDKKAGDFVSGQKIGIDLFCNIVAPCNICACSGPDPNYGHDVSLAPIISYTGPECKGKETLEGPGAATINDYNLKYDYSHRVKAGLPNCCCHLFNKFGINPNNVSLATITRLNAITAEAEEEVNAVLPMIGDITNTTFPLGLPIEIGCEPGGEKVASFLDGKPVTDGKPSESTAYNGNYALAMFQSCLSNKPVAYKAATVSGSGNLPVVPNENSNSTEPNKGIEPYKTNLTGDTTANPPIKSSCFNELGVINTTTLSADKGISANFMFRNEKLWKDIQNRSKTPSSSILDISKYLYGSTPPFDITSTASGSWWSEKGGPSWPAVAPFIGEGVDNTYFYMYTRPDKPTPIRFELKIDRYLQEVYADPVIRPSTNPYCIKPISELNDSTISAFLNFGISALNDPTFIDNSSGKPVITPTSTKYRYYYPKSGTFVFP